MKDSVTEPSDTASEINQQIEDLKDYSIYGIKIEDVHLSVDDKYLQSFNEIGRTLFTRLQNDEVSKIIEFKCPAGDIKEVTVNKQEAFHATALILQHFKERTKAISEFNRLAQHRTDKMICRAKKVMKRRNKKKLNKKFN